MDPIENCKKMDLFIEKWEKEGIRQISSERNMANLQHFDTCSRCKQRYADILPWVKYETSEFTHAGYNFDLSRVEKSLLKAIDEDSPRVLSFPKPLRIIAAAAVLLIAFSFLFTKVGSGYNDEYITVRFELKAPQAQSVYLVGDFSDWNASIYPMLHENNGIWGIEVRLKKGELYRYNFLVDGDKWIADPSNSGTAEDGFGGTSSLIHL